MDIRIRREGLTKLKDVGGSVRIVLPGTRYREIEVAGQKVEKKEPFIVKGTVTDVDDEEVVIEQPHGVKHVSLSQIVLWEENQKDFAFSGRAESTN